MKNNNKQIKNIAILSLSLCVFLLSVYALVGPQANSNSETQISLNSNQEITERVQKIAPTYKQCYDREDGTTICCIPVGKKMNSTNSSVSLCDHFKMIKTENRGLLIVRQTQ